MQELFLHTFEDEMPSLLRKFMTIEQFRHPEFGIQLNRRYVDSQFDAFEALMKEFMDAGITEQFRESNVRCVTAVSAYALKRQSLCLGSGYRKNADMKNMFD